MEVVLDMDTLELWSSEKKELFLHDEIEGELEKSLCLESFPWGKPKSTMKEWSRCLPSFRFYLSLGSEWVYNSSCYFRHGTKCMWGLDTKYWSKLPYLLLPLHLFLGLTVVCMLHFIPNLLATYCFLFFPCLF